MGTETKRRADRVFQDRSSRSVSDFGRRVAPNRPHPGRLKSLACGTNPIRSNLTLEFGPTERDRRDCWRRYCRLGHELLLPPGPAILTGTPWQDRQSRQKRLDCQMDPTRIIQTSPARTGGRPAMEVFDVTVLVETIPDADGVTAPVCGWRSRLWLAVRTGFCILTG